MIVTFVSNVNKFPDHWPLVRARAAWTCVVEVMHDGRTNSHASQARAIPRRGVRSPRTRRRSRAPVAALLLSLLALLAPDLTLAPLQAGEPATGPPRPIDQLDRPSPSGRPLPEPIDEHSTGPVVASTPDFDADLAARLQAALDAARYQGRAYGATVAIARDGLVTWAGASGRARDGRTPLTPESTFVIGSVTKTFVAAAILQLADEGRLELGDPVRRHLPKLSWLSPEITVRQLLDHTSGLADLFNDATKRGLEEHPERAWTTGEVLDTLHAPWYGPGEGWAYANTNYFLLGLIVERLTGSTLADELARRFFVPFGLSTTRVLTGATEDPLQPAWSSIFWGSGAMVSSAADLATWGDLLYTDGVLGRESRVAMFDLNDHDYGLGVQRIELGVVSGYGHTGLLNTYTSLLLHLPADGVTIALLVNRTDVDLAGMLTAKPAGDGPSLLELARGN
jgi:D-alanyl-D-alanine carboxypeptidase